jgi:flagellar biosynthetic protein FliP
VRPSLGVIGLALGAMFLSSDALAAPGAPTPPAMLDVGTVAQSWGPQIKLLAILSILSILPAIVLTMTSFTRTVIVLSFVKQGLGTSQSPPSQVLVGIAIFVTIFTMAPVTSQIAKDAYEPYAAGKISEQVAFDRGAAPLRSFMLRQTREADLALFYEASRTPLPKTEEEVPLRIAVPAFVVSELTTAFQMGVMVLLPFLIIDLIVASVLMSLGMMMMPPSSVSLPLKLLLFVSVDGWHLVIGSLLRSYG